MMEFILQHLPQYGILGIFLVIVIIFYMNAVKMHREERLEWKNDMIALRQEHNAEMKAKNDKVISLAESMTQAVTANTEVMRVYVSQHKTQ